MRKVCQSGCVLLLVLVYASTSLSSIVLENFESGSLPSGWTVTNATGISWDVDGATETNPNILPPEGSYFARSGEPNRHTGDPDGPAEEDTGKLTSPAYSVSYTNLEWLSVGWSGSDPNAPSNENYFLIVDSSFVERFRFHPAQNDEWETASVNLLIDAGLLPGETFYFQAVDTRSASSYGWIGFDELKLTGTQVADPGVVPEATSFLIWGALGLTCCVQRLSRD